MEIKDHEQACIERFGKPYTDVHIWLDWYKGKSGDGFDYTNETGFPAKHREKTHHVEGVLEVIGMWGEEAGEAAKQHILDDFKDINMKQIPMAEDYREIWRSLRI
jgi:hypothetical protein